MLSFVHDANLQTKTRHQQRDSPRRHLWDSLVPSTVDRKPGRLRLEKRGRGRSRDSSRTFQMFYLPPSPNRANYALSEEPDLQSQVELGEFLNMASASQESL